MSKGRIQEEEPQGAPEWIVTFSDITSLLVTFFVLILTFSTLEPEKKNRVVGFLKGAMGIMTRPGESSRNSLRSEDSDLKNRVQEKGQDLPFARDLEDLEEDLDRLQVKHMSGRELRIDKIEGALRIRIAGDRLFDPGSTDLRSDYLPVLAEVADILGYYRNRIIVEGHTDDRFPGDDDLFPPGYELAGRMAAAVAEVLIRQGSVPRGQVSIASYGASRPLTTNATAAGRARNRRVEILVLEKGKGG